MKWPRLLRTRIPSGNLAWDVIDKEFKAIGRVEELPGGDYLLILWTLPDMTPPTAVRYTSLEAVRLALPFLIN